MSLHPLDPQVVAETDEWFYTSHPRGRELRGPDGDTPLHPTSDEDAAGRRAWVAEYRRRLAEKQARERPAPNGGNHGGGGSDPLNPCEGCCPTDFVLAPETMTLEAEETGILIATDSQPAGIGRGAYTWSTTSRKVSLAGADPPPGPQVVDGLTATVVAGSEPSLGPELDEVVEVTRTQSGCAPITKRARIRIQKCKFFRLAQPRIIAIATDSYLSPTTTFADSLLPGAHALGFGQDLAFSIGRRQPHGVSVGTTVAGLDTRMRKLLTEFASGDPHGKARRLFNHFLTPQTAVGFWSDPDLTAAAEAHPNIQSFVSLALSAPISPQRSAGQTRIHQALQNAGWDINTAVAPTDLGVPAFNRGSASLSTIDFNNGLAVMINGLQHAVVVAKEYHLDRCENHYQLKLEFVFYDVFGLDDDDLDEFGADGGFDSDAAEGITAWWQLQHQHGYAPAITRIAFERDYTVPVP